MSYVRTQIYLEPMQHRQLKSQAQKNGISLAQLLREIVAGHLDQAEKTPRFTKDDFMSIVDLGASGSTDVAADHDRYLGQAVAAGHSD